MADLCKVGRLDEARKVFDKNPHPIGATTLISAFGWRDPHKRDISSALAVFDRLIASHSKPNVQVFGALLKACCASGDRAKALSIFDTMQSLYGVTPDEQCFSILSHACGQTGDAATAKLLAHRMTSGALPFIPRESTCIPLVTVLCKASSPSLTDMISLFEWISRRVHIRSTTLYTMFLNRCAAGKDLNAVWQVFDHFLQTKITPNVQIFGALMKACCVCEDRQKALSILDTMQSLHGVIPDEQCFAILSHACGQAGDAATAKMLLQKITSRTLPFVPSGMTCTQLAMALCKSSPPQPGDAMILFDWVIAQPIECASAFYTVLLNGCARCAGLATGRRLHAHIRTNDKVVWDDLLYSTLVDMYGKCGSLHEAQAAFDEARQNWNKYSQPQQQSVSVWNSMINVYGLHGEARRALQMLKDIEHGEVKPEDVHAELTKLWEELKEAGHEPDTRWVTWDEEEEEKAERLCFHSEKLAIAFGLVHTPPGAPLMITKNLRVCPDCHEATKMIAKLRGRLIVVRDANRFHHFHTDGSCSCGDYW